MKSFKEFLNESSMSRFLDHTQKYQCGTISACVGDDCSRHKELADELSRLGFGFTSIIGGYRYNSGKISKEKSYFVIDIKGTQKLKEVLIKLGLKYNQEAVTFAKPGGDFYLINCETKEEIKLGKPHFKVSNFSKSDGNFSSKNNHHFTFNESNIKQFIISLESFNITNNRPNSLWLYNDYIEEQSKLYGSRDFIENQMTFSKHKNIDLI